MCLCLHQNCLFLLSAVYSVTQAVIFMLMNEQELKEMSTYLVTFSKYLNNSTIECHQYV